MQAILTGYLACWSCLILSKYANCQDNQDKAQSLQVSPLTDQGRLNGTKNADELMKTLSRSKASVWVDTNKGNIFSTSIGSSHLERDKSGEPVGRSNNMLLTLLIQPDAKNPIATTASGGQDSNLKPILLLLQQQQDLSEILLERSEKMEKMNVHLLNQVKNQQSLMIDILEQMKMFMEMLTSTGASSNKITRDHIEDLRKKISRSSANENPITSSSSTANAKVVQPKRRATELPANSGPVGKTSGQESGVSSPRSASSVRMLTTNDQPGPSGQSTVQQAPSLPSVSGKPSPDAQRPADLASDQGNDGNVPIDMANINRQIPRYKRRRMLKPIETHSDSEVNGNIRRNAQQPNQPNLLGGLLG